MTINKEELKKYTTGVLYYDETGEPQRLSENQKNAFTADGIKDKARFYFTSGIKISFDTDAESISFVTENGGKYEVYVNYLPVWQKITENGEKAEIALGSGNKCVQIIYPFMKIGKISSVNISGETFVSVHKFDKKFLFYGDSITQGMSAEHDSFCYCAAVSNYYNAEILNQAICGSAAFADTIEKTNFDPDVVFIAYGTNDYGCRRTSIEHLRTETAKYFSKIKSLYGDKAVFVITPIWRADANVRAAGSFEDMIDFYKKTAKENGFIVVDGLTLVPHDPQYYADERLHPNEKGFMLYTLNLIKEIKKYM